MATINKTVEVDLLDLMSSNVGIDISRYLTKKERQRLERIDVEVEVEISNYDVQSSFDISLFLEHLSNTQIEEHLLSENDYKPLLITKSDCTVEHEKLCKRAISMISKDNLTREDLDRIEQNL